MHNNGFRIRKVAFLIIISFVIIWYICAFRSRRSPTRLDVHLSRSPKTHEASSLLQDDNLRTGEGVSVTSVSHKRPESETSPDPHTNGETSQDLVPEPKDETEEGERQGERKTNPEKRHEKRLVQMVRRELAK